jgi:hypothetical protein
MIEESLLKKNFVGRDGFYWWIGQVVDSKKWKGNLPPTPVGAAGDLPGMKERVKVRVMGYHTADTKALSDDDLPWAYIMKPTTAGGGGGGMSQSANFSGGEFVFGFFLDGEDGQQPVIMGILDKSTQLNFGKEIPQIGFVPFSGYSNGLVESPNNIKKDGAPGTPDPASPPASVGSGGAKVGKTIANETAILEQSGARNVQNHGTNAAHENVKKTGQSKSTCSSADDNPAAGIKLAITRLQSMTTFIQKQQGVFLDPLMMKIGNIQNEITRAKDGIAAYMKDIMEKVRGVMTKEVTERMAKLSIKLPIDKMNGFKDELDKALEGLGCGFENIIKGLEGTLNGLLQDMLGKVTGALDCIINDVLGNMINTALGAINGILDSLTGALDSLLGGLGAIQLPLIDAANFLSSLKNLFTCQKDSSCGDVKQFDMLRGNVAEAPSDFLGMIAGALGGGSLIPEPIGGLLQAGSNLSESIQGAVGAVQGVVGSVQGVVGSVQGVVGSVQGVVGSVQGVVGSVSAIDAVSGLPGQVIDGLQACNPFADTCEPPLATIFGGGIVATTANAIINQAGDIIGVDLNGSDVLNSVYDSVPSINFGSNCGEGGGASGQVILNDDGTVDKVVIDEPGTGYPPAPDGSVGGSGNTFATADQTIIRTPDGEQVAVNSNTFVEAPAGSIVLMPSGACVEFPTGTVDQKGNDASGYQCGRGLTDGNGFIVPEQTSIITPTRVQDQVVEGLVYPVVMELDELHIRKTGISYNPGDTITITGDGNSLTFTPTLSTNGAIIDVKIPDDQRGLGFTSIPDVVINTNTGAGAQITPYLRIKYRGIDNIQPVLDRITQDQIISVVDCVGKINVQ